MAKIIFIIVVLSIVKTAFIFAENPSSQTITGPAHQINAADDPDKSLKPQDLFMALGGGDLAFFGALLASGANPNARDPESGQTLLMSSGRVSMTRLLLTHGADPTLTDNLGATALHHAVMSSEALEIIPQLIAKGAAVNARAPGWSNESPLMVAKKLFFQHRANHGAKVMQLLASNGADINATDENGYTVLISAVVNDKPELVRLMIELGSDTKLKANDGLTAMDWAQELGFVDIIELLETAQP